jgi:hypothetical protein
MPWRFHDSRHRISRAKAHSNALAEAWDDITAEDPYAVVIRMESDGTGAMFVRPNYSVDSVSDFALQLGELLYQIRSALDACVYKAAIINTRKNPPPDEENLEFPICCCKTKFKNARCKIRPLSKKHRDIIKSVQPYNAPKLAPEYVVFNFNRALGILNEWARKDRHRKLHVVGSWVAHSSPELRISPPATLQYMNVTGSGFLLENESQIATFKIAGYTSTTKVQGNPHLAIDIAVDEGPPPCADNDTLGNRIRAMLKACDVIVHAFEDAC